LLLEDVSSVMDVEPGGIVTERVSVGIGRLDEWRRLRFAAATAAAMVLLVLLLLLLLLPALQTALGKVRKGNTVGHRS
jgi:hypothetical protein